MDPRSAGLPFMRVGLPSPAAFSRALRALHRGLNSALPASHVPPVRTLAGCCPAPSGAIKDEGGSFAVMYIPGQTAYKGGCRAGSGSMHSRSALPPLFAL